jgi:hypothetical protein
MQKIGPSVLFIVSELFLAAILFIIYRSVSFFTIGIFGITGLLFIALFILLSRNLYKKYKQPIESNSKKASAEPWLILIALALVLGSLWWFISWLDTWIM